MAKKTTKRKSAKTVNSKKNLALSIGVIILALVALIVASIVVAQSIAASHIAERKDRIESIYASLNLGDGLVKEQVNIFGDKRPYEWDKSRSYSSSVTYVSPKPVDETFAELDAKIRAAGFEMFDEPYPGSVNKQYHYKKGGAYVRLSVSSKLRDDAFFNTHWTDGDTTQLDSIDPNAGPSNVTIKVNLDDNNE